MKLAAFWRVSLVVAVLVCLLTSPCHAMDVTLEWDASIDADYYVVYWRTATQTYDISRRVNVGPVITDTITLLPDDTYCLVVRAVDDQGSESVNSREVCVLGPADTGSYDRGWAITEGDLKGFMILFNDPANPPGIDIPTLGPSSSIPNVNLSGVSSVGLPLNLLPSPTVPDFDPPVKIFIPCPGYSDVSGLNVYYYNGFGWALASDTWMVEGSRENHNYSNDPSNDPSTIEIQVKHFSGVQAGRASTSSSGSGGGGGCFIATAADGF